MHPATEWARLRASLVVIRLELLRILAGIYADAAREELDWAWKDGYDQGKAIGYYEGMHGVPIGDLESPYKEDS